jgi:parallel beta-helix repeat protein
MDKRASVLTVLAVLLLISLFRSTIRSTLAFAYTDVSVPEAKATIDSNPSLIILDVRNQSEYDSGHIRNAELIPVWNLTQNLDKLNKSDTILVYCKAGVRSTNASATLVNNNFLRIYNMIGGITGWGQAGYPEYIKYPSIQEAIDNATEYGTILISTGFYTEHLTINKPITLVGENRYTTIIDGSNSGTILHIAADNVSISELTVERPGCTCEGSYGILIEDNHSNISLTDNEMITDSVGINARSAHDVFIAHNNFSQDYVSSMYILNSSNILIISNTMTGFMQGVEFWDSNNIIFSNNILQSSGEGVVIQNSNRSILCGNQFLLDSFGISLYQSNDNLIYDNDFKQNFRDVSSQGSTNRWDDGAQGNFWENYTGVDANMDGIGDTPYVIDANNTDNHPLMGFFASYETNDQEVDFISNSSITGFGFSIVNYPLGTLAFAVAGPNGTQGFCRLCIPKALINGSYTIMFDRQTITEPQFRILPASNENCTYVYINYTHSQHAIEISGSTTIPEFPSFAFLTVSILAMLLAAMVCRRDHFGPPKRPEKSLQDSYTLSP